MSSVVEIENAIRKLPVGEAHALAHWLQDYLASKTDHPASAQSSDVFAAWRGRGHLPIGLNVDGYLSLIRDGDRN